MLIEMFDVSDDETLALAYLLRAEEDSTDLIEQRLLSAPAFFEFLESTEEELLRRYLQDDLPKEMHEAVERIYLQSASLLHVLESTRALLSASGLFSVGQIGIMPFFAALAKRGYVLSVIDGIDCLHEFFDECWPRLSNKRNNSEQILEQFLTFVRPRLVEVCWFRERYMSSGAIESSPAIGDSDLSVVIAGFQIGRAHV